MLRFVILAMVFGQAIALLAPHTSPILAVSGGSGTTHVKTAPLIEGVKWPVALEKYSERQKFATLLDNMHLTEIKESREVKGLGTRIRLTGLREHRSLVNAPNPTPPPGITH
ncbi:hypothetical protein CROQUDRAFT_97041 [Cronartium quercuum f. sp. fusiforme G11]|uniref:Uncharacterized protein n=1 Tax=Cronartium quercuum f. sp. fusiforme G11 TaxID=708437 RepID=A0A9P6NC52_9BASI|nr:hypothetical protein CROQUDRAFT_97041 [Cronartium quercuum f. sp. fusiforme G11]